MKTKLSIIKKCRVSSQCLLALGGAAVVMSGVAVAITPVYAQEQGPDDITKRITLNLDNAPVQAALRTLFSSAGVNYTIDTDVRGDVNVSVTDVSFKTGLETLLRAAEPRLTYSIENGVYHVKVSQTTRPTRSFYQGGRGGGAGTTGAAGATTTATTAPMHTYRIPIDHYDPYIIAELVAVSGNKGVTEVPTNAPSQQQGSTGGTTGGFGGSTGGFGGGIGGSTGGFGGGIGGFGGSTGGFGSTGIGGFR